MSRLNSFITSREASFVRFANALKNHFIQSSLQYLSKLCNNPKINFFFNTISQMHLQLLQLTEFDTYVYHIDYADFSLRSVLLDNSMTL